MLVPFESLAPSSKIWIYQSSKRFSADEVELIKDKTEVFLTEWTAHGHSLQAGVQILHNQFIVIGVNEELNEASGCSIDKSVNYIRSLESALHIQLLDRSKVAYMNNMNVELVNFAELKSLVSSGAIQADTNVFNNAVVSKEELETNWIKPAKESWLKRYF